LKSLPEHLRFEIPDRRGFVNISDSVESIKEMMSAVQQTAGWLNKLPHSGTKKNQSAPKSFENFTSKMQLRTTTSTQNRGSNRL